MLRFSGRTSKVVTRFMLFLGALGAVFVPIAVIPYFSPEAYKEMQTETRRNIRREDIQPGNMNIWSNPFEAKPKKGGKVNEKESLLNFENKKG